jgi:DNA-directed RNA polymerase subunit M/transcription elongation factor TFIIS
MIKCRTCDKSYPSKYYFVTSDTCNECFSKLDTPAQEHLLQSVESLEKEGVSPRSVDGHDLTCPVCKHDKFWTRKTLMNTPGMTFWGIEWANREGENFVCDSCGYVMWFLR